jgi:hypothetical protein
VKQDGALDASARAMLYRDDDPRWVDKAGVGDVSVLVTPGTERATVSTHLFWNESLRHVLLLPDAVAPDAYSSDEARIARDGRLLVGDRPLRTPLLVEESQSQAEFAGARLIHRGADASLWAPTGALRLSMLTVGRNRDGGLSWPEATVRLWPEGDASATLCLAVSNPVPETRTIVVEAPTGSQTLRLAPYARRVLLLPVRGSAPWTAILRGHTASTVSGRLVFARLEPPTLVNGAIRPQAAPPQCR